MTATMTDLEDRTYLLIAFGPEKLAEFRDVLHGELTADQRARATALLDALEQELPTRVAVMTARDDAELEALADLLIAEAQR